MKKFIVLFAFVSLSAQASLLTSFTVVRMGGGQIDATIADSDEGLEITLKSCSYRNAPANTVAKVVGQDIVDAAKTLLAGKAIIAQDVSPDMGMASGSWLQLNYTLNPNELPPFVEHDQLDREVHSPIIIINGQISTVLRDLEVQARKLCK